MENGVNNIIITAVAAAVLEYVLQGLDNIKIVVAGP